MSDEELRDELVTLLLAGHETTATSVAWAIERLVRHPDKLERLIGEIDEGGEEYLEATVNETLRVRPVVPIVVRVLQQELEVGDMLLPAGTRVAPVRVPDQPQPGRLRAAAGVPPGALPRQEPRTPSPGSPSGAASAAASAPPSRSWR